MFQQKHPGHGHSLLNHVLMKRAAFDVALKEKQPIAEGTVAFRFEKPNGFQMQAGQHIRMTLIDPPETDSEGNSRFFSLANAPHEADLLIAMRMRETAFKRVLGRMPMGDKVRIEIPLKSPHGAWTLHEDASKPAVFLIGGIGIAPAFSVIKDALERHLPHSLVLFYSNRRAEDAPFLDELETLARQHPSLTLIPTLTQPERSASPWRGETGHIDQVMLKRYVGDLLLPVYYLAGLPDMVSAMKTMLTAAGVREEHIHAEAFTGFNLNDIQTRGMNHLIHHMRPPVQQAQKGETPRKAARSLKERVAAAGSSLFSFLANLHSSMLHLILAPIGMLVHPFMGGHGLLLLVTAAGVLGAPADSPWLRRSMLLVALLMASFTLSRLLSRKYTGRTLLFRSLSLLFTAGMISWSIATVGF
jgi:ferredoxin-NADP reductase